MAVVDSFPGLKVEIIVNGMPLIEYASDDENEQLKPDTITMFVEATTGAEFLIRCTFEDTFEYKNYAISAALYIDGTFIATHYRSLDKSNHNTGRLQLEGMNSRLDNGTYQLQTFAFSPQQIDHESQSVIDKATRTKIAALGSVSIRLYRMKLTWEIKKHHVDVTSSRASLNPIEVSEKDLKGRAISHCVTLGSARNYTKRKSRRSWTREYIDPSGSPFAVFNFKYRSLQALKDLRLASRSPSPIPIEDRPVEELDLEQLREIARKAQARRNAFPNEIKREFKDEPGDDDDGEISFVEQRPCKVARISTRPVETIDLT